MSDDIVAQLWRVYERGDKDAIRLASYAADEITRLRAELAKRDELLLDCASALWPFSDWLDAKRGIGMEHFNRAADIRSRIELFVGPARGYGDE